MVILGFFLLIAVIGPWIAPYDPSARSDDILQPPSWEHWFGTTHLGQDVFSQLLVGTRGVIVVGFVAGIVATAIGVIVGVTAGYLGGVGDETLSVFANVFLVIPQLPLIIIIAGQLPTVGGVDRRARHRRHRLGVGRARAARADAVAAPTRLRRGGARERRAHVAHHHAPRSCRT